MTRVTVEDSTAGQGQTLCTVAMPCKRHIMWTTATGCDAGAQQQRFRGDRLACGRTHIFRVSCSPNHGTRSLLLESVVNRTHEQTRPRNLQKSARRKILCIEEFEDMSSGGLRTQTILPPLAIVQAAGARVQGRRYLAFLIWSKSQQIPLLRMHCGQSESTLRRLRRQPNRFQTFLP